MGDVGYQGAYPIEDNSTSLLTELEIPEAG